MKTKIFLICLSAIGLTVSCTTEDLSENVVPAAFPESETIVLQERDPNSPTTDYAALLANGRTRSTVDTDVKDLIGYSFKTAYYPLEDIRNVGFRVIDMERFLVKNPELYESLPQKRTSVQSHSFVNFDRYEQNTEITRVVTEGFELNLGIFSVGSKETFTEVFKETQIEESQRVYGEMSIEYLNHLCKILTLPSVIEDIRNNYLHENFLRAFYYNSPDHVFDQYGGFVLTQFFTGGLARVLYCGAYDSDTQVSSDVKERDMETEIGASYDDTGGNYTIGKNKNNDSDISVTEHFQDIQFSVVTIGGNPIHAQFSIPERINSGTIDLSGWSASLADESTHTISMLPDESLVPLSEFIEEENLKTDFELFYRFGPPDEKRPLIEPYIDIAATLINDDSFPPFFGKVKYACETRLMTRYGDAIILNREMIPVLTLESYKAKELERVRRMFRSLRIVSTMSAQNTPLPGLIIPNKYYVNQFDVDNMTKLTDPVTGKLYLLTETIVAGVDVTEKRAYTLYDQHVINDYLFRDIIDDLPVETEVDLDTVRRDYTLIAL